MARLTGIISKLNGSAGNLTFRQKSGKTIVSEKITQTTNAKTELQVKHRMKWANIIREYQVLQPYMKLAFGGTRNCLLYTSPSPRDDWLSRMPSSA